jgi:hypothetical protein
MLSTLSRLMKQTSGPSTPPDLTKTRESVALFLA